MVHPAAFHSAVCGSTTPLRRRCPPSLGLAPSPPLLLPDRMLPTAVIRSAMHSDAISKQRARSRIAPGGSMTLPTQPTG